MLAYQHHLRGWYTNICDSDKHQGSDIVIHNASIGQDIETEAGPRLNIKTVLSTYGDFHVKDKTAVRTSYL